MLILYFSLNSIKEAAVIVGIQALAEQGCWQNVIPFVEQAYHQIGACPAKVIHMWWVWFYEEVI